MPKKQRKHQRRHVRSQLFDQHWAIHEPALAAMDAILRDQAEGHDLGADVMARRFGMYGPAESQMRIIGNVAVIPITGVLQPGTNSVVRYYGGTSTSQVESDFKAAMRDTRIRSVVLLVDSPGGSAMGNEEVARTIFAARGTKPITAYVRGLCASAAYYLASAADRIVASPSSMIGSIGTIYMHADYSEYLKDFGIEVTNVTHGKHKADGSPYVKFSDQSRQTMQERVNEYGEQFVAAVARHRGVSSADVMERFGQGKVFIADAAKSRGMIDAIGTIDDVLAQNPDDEDPAESRGTAANAQQLDGTTVILSEAEAEGIYQLAGTATTTNQGKPAAKQAASQTEDSIMWKKIKAALFSRGLIESIDASDDVCKAVLAGYFRGQVPESEEQILESLNAQTRSEGQTQTQTQDPNAQQPAPNVQQAHDREIEEAKAEARLQERERRKSIESAGRLLGMSAEVIQQAVDSNDKDQDIIAAWHRQLAEAEQPVNNTSVNVRGEGADRFAIDAIDAMLLRAGYNAASEEPSREAQELQSAPLSFVARRSLEIAGQRVSPYADAEQVALDALQMGGMSVAVISASGVAYNRPGDFPNLLSNLANKILDQAILIAEPTYPVWTARLADLPDFKPRTIIGIGHLDELDQLTDDEDPSALAMDEEMAGWIQAGRYGNKIGLTPVMVANDDLDAFTTGLQSLAMAHEHTLNRLCLALIAGNVTLPDGYSLFDDTNHGNDVTAGNGGAPSTTQANKMRLKHRRQTGIGGKGKVRTGPKIALVPTAYEEVAMQTFLAFTRLNESKLPVTDATINTFRGSIEPVVEPDLEDYSTAYWYTFADPRVRRTVVHAFQRGFGRGGRRTRWFDPARKTMYVDLEGRFAAAVAGHRGAVRNVGA